MSRRLSLRLVTARAVDEVPEGPADAESAITGAAGEFCRVAAQRLDPAQTGLQASGPHGATALRLVRTYAA